MKSGTTFIQRAWLALQSFTGPREAALTRIRRGVLYGLWMGGLFGLAATTVDYFTITTLPLRLEWPAIAARAGLAALLLGGIMAVTNWPHSFWRGTITGAALTVLGALIVLMVQVAPRFESGGVLLLLFLLPAYATLTLPFSALLRWIVHTHARNLQRPGPNRWLTLAGLSALVGLVSLWSGTWLKMSDGALAAARRVETFVNAALPAASDADLPYVLKDFPGFRAHAGVPYYLTVQPDPYSLEGFDVTLKFDDGYRLTCLALLRPSPTVMRCAESETLYP